MPRDLTGRAHRAGSERRDRAGARAAAEPGPDASAVRRCAGPLRAEERSRRAMALGAARFSAPPGAPSAAGDAKMSGLQTCTVLRER